MTTHTPGPWHINGHQIFGGEEHKHIARVNEARDNWQADRNLIEAAPELLAALKMAEDYLGGWPRDPQQRHAREAVRAAIAKAEGGQS